MRERLLELEISQEEKEKSIELISKLRQKEKAEADLKLKELEKKQEFELKKARKEFDVKMDKQLDIIDGLMKEKSSLQK